jgi:3-hydroxybutyryl-CoA dehydrogenase
MEIKTIGVIGAATIGPGIAYLAASSGYQSMLQGVSQELLEDGIAHIRRALKGAVDTGAITRQQEQESLANISTSRSVEDVCRQADLLIEATQEELEVKLEIFTLFDKFAKPNAILASSSLTIPISDLSEITFRAENCVAMRFRAPVPQAKFMNIIRTAGTSEATVKTCVEVGQRMGREVVVTRQ